jgi:thiol:disulfide interchange protein DsbD
MLTPVLAAMPSFLMPNEAFMPKISKQSDARYRVSIDLGKDIYVYENKVKVTDVDKEDGIDLHVKSLTTSVMHHDEMVFLEPPEFDVTLVNSGDSSGVKKVKISVAYQGCSEKGLCYNPMTKEFVIDVDTSKLRQKESKTATSVAQSESVSESDMIAQSFKSGSVLLVLATFFGFGLFLAMTPCVFPMIPILSSIIVSQGSGMTAKRGFFLSLVYVLAMAVAYTLAGVLAGLFGANIQVALQDPLVLSLFALIFVALAFSMFGFFEIGIPHSWQTKITKHSDKASSSGGVIGVAIMGFLSALIVGPCIAPPLAGALIYIGQSGDALLGGAALFVMSLGMGVPLLIVGIGAGKFMPKPGGWMNNVSKIFGVMMLGIAIWMLSRILPEWTTMLLWAFLFIISSVYMGALEHLRGDQHGVNALVKGVGIIFLLYGTALFYGALSGATNPLNPLEKVASPAQNVLKSSDIKTFITVHTAEELAIQLQKAKGKKVLLDFYADWCTSCKEYEHVTFKDPAVREKMAEFVLIQADVTQNTDAQKALTKQFGLFGPPAIIFFDTEGKQIVGKDIIGYKPPQEFLKLLNAL